MFTSLRVNKVEFTLSQCTICYDMSLITLLSHLLGAFEGFQNYNLININTKHASYKTGSRKKIILSAIARSTHVHLKILDWRKGV